jgi:hypothetical protein
MKKVTIYGEYELDDNGNNRAERVTLPAPFYKAGVNGQEDYTGVWVTGLYYGPRSGRCFVEDYSIWDDGHGAITGKIIREVSLSELLRIANHVGAFLPDCIPAPVIA